MLDACSLTVDLLRRSATDLSPDAHAMVEVTPDYFATLGLRITRGRSFAPSDAAPGRPVIILNETVARMLFAEEDPIGKCVFRLDDTCTEVVGVSEPFRGTINPASQVDSQVFVPLRRAESVPQVLLIRTRGSASGEIPAIAAALQGAAADLPYVKVQLLSDLVDANARSWLLGATAFGMFAALAIVLAAVGIYGALAFSVRLQTQEIGVRIALGAAGTQIAGMVVRHGAFVVLVGTALGAAGAFAASRFIGSLLFNVAPGDPATFFIAVAVIAIAALAGCIVPAARAARTEPAAALRYE